jgi:aspartate aminotransferase-like enzyme
MLTKARIMAPGPTEIPPSVLAAAAKPILHHRTSEFRAIFSDVTEKIKYVFQTSRPILTLAASGTGGLEAVITNITLPGDKVIVISGGVFGERWAKIAEAHGRVVHRIVIEWGKVAKAQDVANAIADHPDASLICATLSETSTGVMHPIKEFAEVTRASNIPLAVDAVSGLAVCELQTDEWGVDVVVAGSQKGLMIPPGLAFITMSERAWKQVEVKNAPSFYFSLKQAMSKLTEEKLPDTPWTPNVSLVCQLQESLKLIHTEGIENIFQRHLLLAEATREAISAMGLQLFAQESPNPGVTSVHSPEGVDSGIIVKKLREEWGISIVGGQGKVKGKIFRIGHMGYCDRTDVLMTIAALECVLVELGVSISSGAGVSKAQDIFLKK